MIGNSYGFYYYNFQFQYYFTTFYSFPLNELDALFFFMFNTTNIELSFFLRGSTPHPSVEGYFVAEWTHIRHAVPGK